VTFEIVSAFEPLARLERRDGTMDGAVPLRVAQACVPLLEGNALGLQVVFRKRLTVRARLGRLAIVEDAARSAIDAAHRAAVPLLVARGLLGRAWEQRLTRAWWWTERGTLRVWTGLLARPRPGTWLRVTGPGNRAALDVRVQDTWIGDFDAPVPLVLDLAVEGGARLDAEVATVVPVVPSVRARIVPLAEARALADAHAAFYDAKYFATKKGEVTRKYRRTIARRKEEEDEAEGDDGELRVAHVAGPRPELVRIDRVLGPGASTPVAAPPGTRLDVVRFLNAVPFRAHYDGNTLAVEPERDVLAAGARVVEAALGEDYVGAHKGATLYLTKYFTPHPSGEPHFFVKPWAFVETPRGWSSVVDGHRGAGWSVMRGVVRTDGFHATPAVFHVAPMRRIAIGLGEPLVDVIAAPRAVLAEEAVHTRLT
jgi:hypothetical protein